MNGDGLDDIVWRGANGGILIWQAVTQGVNLFAETNIGNVPNEWQIF